MPARIQRVVNWLRAGYPQGIPDRDFVPLFALLRRRLSEEEARELAADLAEKGLITPDKIDIAVGYLRITDELASHDELVRVIAHLRENGWEIRDEPLDADAGEVHLEQLTQRCADDLAAAAHDWGLLAQARGAALALLAHYDEPIRAYHDRTHLAEMLSAFTELSEHLALPPQRRLEGRLAVWFHDAVYDPQAPAGTNERASAQLAATTLGSLRASAELTDAVHLLVAATADHRITESSPLREVGAALLDADLWILAAPAPRFDEYCAQVRREYGFVDDATYADARSSILRDLVDRPRLYVTDLAHEGWTEAAQANVERELERLRA